MGKAHEKKTGVTMKNNKVETTRVGEAYPLLDSSLITTSKIKKYSVKVIECGEYTQLYLYPKLKIRHMDEDGLSKGGGYSRVGEGTIEYKNLVRAKNQMSRLVMANYSEFTTFITLTFAENLTNIKKANAVFNDWVGNLKKRLKSDFKYIAVPEFQKRGAIHYHLLTNIDYNSFSLLSKDELRLYSPTSRTWEVGRSVLSWKQGYSLAKDITSDEYDLIGYMAKYMLKDFDNRLFAHRRYLYSQNLEKPCEKVLDLDIDSDIDYLQKLVSNKAIRFESVYKDKLTGEDVQFVELCCETNGLEV